jgi:hypothetical protein
MRATSLSHVAFAIVRDGRPRAIAFVAKQSRTSHRADDSSVAIALARPSAVSEAKAIASVMLAFQCALQVRETIRAEYRAEPYAGLEPWRAAILLWPASAASLSSGAQRRS